MQIDAPRPHGRSKRSLRFWAIPPAIALLCLCCVDFHGQTMTVRYDAERDRLLIFQLYEGIYAQGVEPTPRKRRSRAQRQRVPTEEEKAQLEKLLHEPRTFFFDNWIAAFGAAGFAARLEEQRSSLADAEPEERRAIELLIPLLEHLAKHFRVTNGAFFVDDEGRLCGYQYVVLDKVGELLPLVNRAIGLHVETKGLESFSGEDRRRIEARIAAADWVVIEGGQIRIRVPMRWEEFGESRLITAAFTVGAAPGSLWVSDDAGQEFVLNYDEPLAEIVLGRRLGREFTLRAHRTRDVSDNNLVRHVRSRFGLVAQPDLSALRRAFFESGEAPAPDPDPPAP